MCTTFQISIYKKFSQNFISQSRAFRINQWMGRYVDSRKINQGINNFNYSSYVWLFLVIGATIELFRFPVNNQPFIPYANTICIICTYTLHTFLSLAIRLCQQLIVSYSTKHLAQYIHLKMMADTKKGIQASLSMRSVGMTIV